MSTAAGRAPHPPSKPANRGHVAAHANVLRLALSQKEAAEALGVSEDFFQEHLRSELRVVRRGRRRLYPVSELERWLDKHASSPLEDLR